MWSIITDQGFEFNGNFIGIICDADSSSLVGNQTRKHVLIVWENHGEFSAHNNSRTEPRQNHLVSEHKDRHSIANDLCERAAKNPNGEAQLSVIGGQLILNILQERLIVINNDGTVRADLELPNMEWNDVADLIIGYYASLTRRI